MTPPPVVLKRGDPPWADGQRNSGIGVSRAVWFAADAQSAVRLYSLAKFPCSMNGSRNGPQLWFTPADGTPSFLCSAWTVLLVLGRTAPGGKNLCWLSKLFSPRPICFRLFWHWVRAAASRTFWTA